MIWDTILDRFVKKSSLEDLSTCSELTEIQIVHVLRKRVPDRRNSVCRCCAVEALTFMRNGQEASTDWREEGVKGVRV